MKQLAAHMMAIAALLVLAACNHGQSASPPPGGISVAPRDGGVIVSWTPESGVDYWLFYAASSDLSSKTAYRLGGKIVPDVASPATVRGLTNGTTYYFTVNGRRNGGPGGDDAPVVSATPRLAGFTWDAGLAAGSSDLRAVAFGARFVAAGAGGAMFSSPDGVAWTAVPFAAASDINAVIYNGSPAFYVASGAAGTILTSADGQTWQIQNSGTANDLSGLASNGSGYIVGVGANGTIVGSSGGAVWTVLASATTQNLNAVAYGDARMVAVGASGVILTSTDGITWQPAASGTSTALNGIAFAPAASLALNGISSTTGRFVAVGAAGTVLTSTDGVTWTPQPAVGPNHLAAVTFGTQFVAVGSSGSIFTSIDGLSWTARTSGSGNDLNAVAHGNFGYSAVGAAGTNLTAY